MFEKVEQFWQAHSALILNVVYNILLTVGVLVACVIVSTLIRRAIGRANRRAEHIDSTLVPVLVTSSKYLIYAIGIVIVLDIFGVNTSSIIALLGAVGLAVAFALKDTLSNIAAGIMLLILRPFRVEELVEYNSILGTVKEVNLFTTILETPDGIYVSAPNGAVWGNTIKNFTRNGKRRIEIVVGISYGDSMDKGLKILSQVIASESRILSNPTPQTMVASMGDSAVNLQLRVWTTVKDYWPTLWDLNKKVKESIEAGGVSIPFPQRDVHMLPSSIKETELCE